MIADIKNIFGDSKINEVFSADGLTALENFEFYRMYIFYALVIKTLAFFVLLKKTMSLDKENSTV